MFRSGGRDHDKSDVSEKDSLSLSGSNCLSADEAESRDNSVTLYA
jgi:hypothetical protein